MAVDSSGGISAYKCSLQSSAHWIRTSAQLQQSIDTPEEFLNFTEFYTTARIATVPLGYNLVGQALNGSVYGQVFRGVQLLTSYDPVSCAGICSGMTFCTSFNICEPNDNIPRRGCLREAVADACSADYERDPVLNPDPVNCPNPNSTTNIKCVFWGSSISEELALNDGEIRSSFRVVIAGSNYYIKQDALNNLTDLGFYGPRGDGQSNTIFSADDLIEPTDKYPTFIGGYRGFYARRPEGPSYDPTICAKKCNKLTIHNSVNKVNSTPYINGAYPKCNMFTIFEDVQTDAVPFSIVCFFFSTSWDSKYATTVVGSDRKGRKLTANLVKIYQRLDYPDPPICVLDSCDGAQYYSGGNCSGWGRNYCRHP
ncbi:hypothetical protein VM1G_10433 [Cytospora mali]|uniref:Uncharacterized protein n=1 Tax=Cytospora mali TaxID=578113 RepID=A0A194VI83_CYTMA|nr:hypothetical protein VM1G_10433 [Valsa mali]